MAKAKQIDVIVARGEVLVGYSGERVEGINDRGQMVVLSMGEPIMKGPGSRITLDEDEAHRLILRGIVRLPAVEGDLPAPGGVNLPKVGTTEGVMVAENVA